MRLSLLAALTAALIAGPALAKDAAPAFTTVPLTNQTPASEGTVYIGIDPAEAAEAAEVDVAAKAAAAKAAQAAIPAQGAGTPSGIAPAQPSTSIAGSPLPPIPAGAPLIGGAPAAEAAPASPATGAGEPALEVSTSPTPAPVKTYGTLKAAAEDGLDPLGARKPALKAAQAQVEEVAVFNWLDPVAYLGLLKNPPQFVKFGAFGVLGLGLLAWFVRRRRS